MKTKDAVEKLLINNKLEYTNPNIAFVSSQYMEYMTAYSLVFPDSEIAHHWDRLKTRIGDIFDNVPTYILTIPTNYSQEVFKVINNYVKSF